MAFRFHFKEKCSLASLGWSTPDCVSEGFSTAGYWSCSDGELCYTYSGAGKPQRKGENIEVVDSLFLLEYNRSQGTVALGSPGKEQLQVAYTNIPMEPLLVPCCQLFGEKGGQVELVPCYRWR